MKTYLTNLLPRVQQYSQSLDKKELLIDQPWVLMDDEGNKQQYIFERGGNLIMSHNGTVQYGKWRYIHSNNSLLIDRANDSLLLNHQFFTDALCVLKKDGYKDDPWMLVNEKRIPDLDVQSYLESLVRQLEKPEPKDYSKAEEGGNDDNSFVIFVIITVVSLLLMIIGLSAQ